MFVRICLYQIINEMPSKQIGKYQVQQIIGEGSFGKVYLGTYNNEKYALKFIPKKSCQYKDIVKMKMEVDLLSKLKNLNIIDLKQCIQTDNELIVVMEHAGTDLSEVLRKEKKLSEDRLVNYAKQILNAMLYLKDSRIMHRDLKPQNILLQKDTIKICDFGFAKKLSASTQFLRSIKGTPLYIAPQILLEKPYTDKVDVWSFGIILFELATGRPPFMASTIQQLKPKIFHQPVICPSSMNPLLSQLIKGMLQKRDVMRYSWEQVKNHKYFTESIPLSILKPPIKEQKEQIIKIEEVVWNAEQECAYMNKIDAQVQSDKIKLLQLKDNEAFWERFKTMIGKVCHDRKKVPIQILLKVLKLAIRSLMQKSDSRENLKEDISQKKSLNAAIVSLAIQEKNEELLQAELEIIGYLLKINFDGHKIDTEYDEIITTITSQHLRKKKGGHLTKICLKVLGILTSQAVLTLNQSYQYFERISKEKLVTYIAECYNVIPESHIVLQCLQKFIHPRQQRYGTLTYKARATFKALKQEVAPVLLKNKFISETCLMNNSWKKPYQVQIYCEILMQCLSVSEQFRNEFLNYNYWQELMTIKNTKLYYLVLVYIINKQSGIHLLSGQRVQNEIVLEQFYNKFSNIFLIYLAFGKIKNVSSSRNILEKVKSMVSNIKNMLITDPKVKTKCCQQIFGSQAQEHQIFDDILLQVLYKIDKQLSIQEMKIYIQNVAAQALNLTLSHQSLVKVIQIFQIKNGLQIGKQQSIRLSQILIDYIRSDSLEDYMSLYPKECSKLIFYLLTNQLNRMNEQGEKQASQFLDIMQKNNFIQLLFNENMAEQLLMLANLKLINKLSTKMKVNTVVFLADTGFQLIKKYFSTKNEELVLEIITFCSFLARANKEVVVDLLQSKVVQLASRCLNQGNQFIKQKTLHLIGNLSKYNQSAFQQFQKYGIIQAIAYCLKQYKSSRKILKNTIYCIGNISYYSDRFAQDLGPIIKCLRDGLIFEDENLLQNTLSTISNMLRHSDINVPALRDSGVLARVMQIYEAAYNHELVNLCNNLLKKALQKPKSFDESDRGKLKLIFQKHMRKRLLDINNQNSRRMLQVLG